MSRLTDRVASFGIASAAVLALIVSHEVGYWQGARQSHERTILQTTEYAATICVASQLVTLRQMTRLIEAKNRKPIVVECRR
jgi:hypothetical protein